MARFMLTSLAAVLAAGLFCFSGVESHLEIMTSDEHKPFENYREHLVHEVTKEVLGSQLFQQHYSTKENDDDANKDLPQGAPVFAHVNTFDENREALAILVACGVIPHDQGAHGQHFDDESIDIGVLKKDVSDIVGAAKVENAETFTYETAVELLVALATEGYAHETPAKQAAARKLRADAKTGKKLDGYLMALEFLIAGVSEDLDDAKVPEIHHRSTNAFMAKAVSNWQQLVTGHKQQFA